MKSRIVVPLFLAFIMISAPAAWSSFGTNINLANLGDNGCDILGAAAGDEAGSSLAMLPDASGDGIADILIGAPYANGTGAVYLVYGKDGFSAGGDIDLASLGASGMVIYGEAQNDLLGWAVASLGDVNSDSLGDFLISAPGHDPDLGGVREDAGRCYLIYGSDSFGATLDLSSLTADDGIIINGASDFDMIGLSLAAAGDFGGTADPDFAIGAPLKDANGALAAGVAYVVFWDSGISSEIDLASGLGAQGVVFEGSGYIESAGFSVSGDFDFNNDGNSDLLLGSPGAGYGQLDYAGRAYLLYGRSGFTSPFLLSDVTAGGGYGVAFDGASAYEQAGFSVLGIHDFNLDGFDDAAIAAPLASPNGLYSGRTYIVYGSDSSPSQVDLVSIGEDGLTLDGESEEDGKYGLSLADLSDVNGDGITDIAIGAQNSISQGMYYAGVSYLVIGCRFHEESGELGSMMRKQSLFNGAKVGDFSGCAIAGGEDLDNDGLLDVVIGACGYSNGSDYNMGRVHFVKGQNLGGSAWPFSPPTTGVGTQGNGMSYVPYIDAWGDFTSGGALGIDVGIQIDTAWSMQTYPYFFGYLMLSTGDVNTTGEPFKNTLIWPRFYFNTQVLLCPVFSDTGYRTMTGFLPPNMQNFRFYLQAFWENPNDPNNWAASNCRCITFGPQFP